MGPRRSCSISVSLMVVAGVDDQRKRAESGLLAEPVDEGEAGAVGECEVEDEDVGGESRQACMASWMVETCSMVTMVVEAGGGCGGFKAGEDDGGEVEVVFDEQDASWSGAGVKDAAEFGEEEVFVEGLLHPALRGGDERRAVAVARGGGKDAEDDDGDVCGGGILS